MEEHVQAVAAVSDVVELGDQVQAAGLAVRGNRGALGVQLGGAVGVGVEDGVWVGGVRDGSPFVMVCCFRGAIVVVFLSINTLLEEEVKHSYEWHAFRCEVPICG